MSLPFTPDDRTLDGMRSAADILDAIRHNHIQEATDLVNDCDPAPTVYALATAWLSLALAEDLNTDDLMRQMRDTIDHFTAREGGA